MQTHEMTYQQIYDNVATRVLLNLTLVVIHLTKKKNFLTLTTEYDKNCHSKYPLHFNLGKNPCITEPSYTLLTMNQRVPGCYPQACDNNDDVGTEQCFIQVQTQP